MFTSAIRIVARVFILLIASSIITISISWVMAAIGPLLEQTSSHSSTPLSFWTTTSAQATFFDCTTANHIGVSFRRCIGFRSTGDGTVLVRSVIECRMGVPFRCVTMLVHDGSLGDLQRSVWTKAGQRVNASRTLGTRVEYTPLAGNVLVFAMLILGLVAIGKCWRRRAGSRAGTTVAHI
jgi:hypothetical protein